MNALVIYDSTYGITEKVAKVIAGTLNKFGSAEAVYVADASIGRLEGVDLLIVGSPTMEKKPTLAMRSFLGKIPQNYLCNTLAACFDTRLHAPRMLTGSAADEMEKMLEKTGALIVARPESFLVDGTDGPLHEGEIERAAAWALALLDLQREREKEKEKNKSEA